MSALNPKTSPRRSNILRWATLLLALIVAAAPAITASHSRLHPDPNGSEVPWVDTGVTEHAGHQPECSDGIDNDGDGQTDYPYDSMCLGPGDDSESTNPECSDGIDNDGDGHTDHPNDPDCASPYQDREWSFQCADGIDNDGDGLVDMDDPGCFAVWDNNETNPQCNDGIDNDGDGYVDYPQDPGCTSIHDNTEGPNSACSDGIDNDGDGLTDYPNDPGCIAYWDDDETDPACRDGIDNDGDGHTDYPDDPGCADPNDPDETDPPVPPQCSDGIDNDLDGRTDYPGDAGCTSASDNNEGSVDPQFWPTYADHNDGTCTVWNDGNRNGQVDTGESFWTIPCGSHGWSSCGGPSRVEFWLHLWGFAGCIGAAVVLPNTTCSPAIRKELIVFDVALLEQDGSSCTLAGVWIHPESP